MAEDLQLIRRFVDALVRQERRVLAGTAAGRLGVLGAALVVLSVFAARGHWDRSAVLMVLVGAAALGLWLAVWVPMLTRWRPSGDRIRQARMVEDLAPELRGRLVTAVGHTRGAEGVESPALLALVARRAAAVARAFPVRRVHPAGHVLRTIGLAMVAWLIALPSTFIAPGGPVGLLRFWGSGLDARAAAAAVAVTSQEDTARVGDLVITYTYPSYTGLDPHQVSNTTGDVTGPPGTVVEVTARTADPVEAAGLTAYDQTFDAQTAEDGRQISGRFRIAADEGEWRMVLYRGGEPERSRAFMIAPEPDLPPEVILDASGPVLEVAVDESFPLSWRARDDYGVSKVSLRVDRGDEERLLYEADSRKAEVFDQQRLRPTDLGLGPGAEVDLEVVAWDNDTVSGSKMGTSAVLRLRVLGAMGQDARRSERHAELEALMVPVLARFLTEDWPPGDRSRDVVRWGESVAHRYEPIQAAVDKDWGRLSDDALDRMFVTRVLTSGRDLVRYTQVAFPVEGSARPSAVDMVEVAEMRDEAVDAVERALLAFLKEAQLKALADVAKKANELEQAADLLTEALNREDPDKLELLARLDQHERLLAQLMELSAKLADGGLKSFVNLREHELQSLMDEIRSAIAEGRMDDAKRLMERLASQVKDLAEGVRQDLESRQSQGESAADDGKELVKELRELEDLQRELQSQVRALREREDAQGAEEAARLWERVDELTEEVLKTGRRYRTALDDSERPFYERERASAGVEAVEVLRSAVRARDVRGSREALAEAAHHWMVVQRTAFGLFERTDGLEGPRPEVAGAIERKLRKIDDLLDKLDQTSDQLSPDALQQAEQLRDQQKDLQNRLEQAKRQAGEVMRNLPVEPQGMPQALDEAGERMEQAGEDLGEGRAMAAEGSQGVAAERIRKARSALEQAIKASQQMGQAGQGQGQSGEKRQPGDEDGDDQSQQFGAPEDIYIPGREAYESPEAYRKALLEGMQGDVPDAYRAWKKRYYEELVQQ